MLSSRPIQLSTDGAYFPAKTPSRGLKNRIENAHAAGGVAMTLNAKGKSTTFAPKTPFQPASAQPHSLLGKDQKIVLTTKRALGDKTPLPNRFGNVLFQTPLPGISKLSKLNQEAGRGGDEGAGGTPDSVQRPSSTRKHIKHPRNSSKFETPVNNGNHWDISDGDIVVIDAQPMVQDTILEDDMDEVEYGPPNTLDLPYEPPFDFKLPDYKQVGKTLRQLAFSVHYDEISAPLEPDIPAFQLESIVWDMIPLPDLESDDPFHISRLEAYESSTGINPESQPVLPSRGVKPAVRPVIKSVLQPSSSAPAIKAADRPTNRAAPSRSTLVASRVQRAPSTSSVRSAGSNAIDASSKNSSRTVAPRNGLSAAGREYSTKPKLPSAVKKLASGVVAKKLGPAPSNTTAVSGVRPVPLPRAAAGSQRPHTSMTLTSNVKPRVGAASSTSIRRVKAAVAPPPAEQDIFLAADLDILEELDFKFDV